MGVIHLKAELSEVTVDNLNEFSTAHIDRRDMRDLLRRDGFLDAFLKRDLSRWEQDCINDHANISVEQVCEIIKNCKEVDTSVIHRHKNIPSEVLTEYASKLPLYHIEYQINITPEFFNEHREAMDVSTFLDYRSQLGDVHNFINISKGDIEYVERYVRYNTPRESVLDLLVKVKPDLDIASTNKVLDEIYNHEVNVQYLTDCYTNNNNVSHTVRDVVRYYNDHHSSQYATWTDYVNNAVSNEDTALADVWFRDVFQKRIFDLVK